MRKTLLLLAALLVVGGVGYYALSPLFRTIAVDEEIPVAVQKEVEGEASPVISSSVPVVDTPAHPASGSVRVVTSGEATYIRYENYKTINGPDLYVYLAKDLDAKEFVDLGRIRATEGNVNYEVPDGVSLADYPYVLTWCKAFGVLFNSADLSGIAS